MTTTPTDEPRHAAEAWLHNQDGRCTSLCGIGCEPGTCDCDCGDPACPINFAEEFGEATR